MKKCFVCVSYSYTAAKLQIIFLKMKFLCSKNAILCYLVGSTHKSPPHYVLFSLFLSSFPCLFFLFSKIANRFLLFLKTHFARPF